MSDKRISELVELTSLAADDELVVVDADANGTKRITATNLSGFPSKVTAPSIEVADGGTIGSASDSDAITIDATGNVALSQALQLGDSTAISRLGADSFRLVSLGVANGVLTSWERVDEATSAGLGTNINEASGVFNVPNTGIWLIMFSALIYADPDGNDDDVNASIRVNGNEAVMIQARDTGSGFQDGGTCAGFFVGELSPTDDVDFFASSLSAGSIRAETNRTVTGATFIRLGDA